MTRKSQSFNVNKFYDNTSPSNTDGTGGIGPRKNNLPPPLTTTDADGNETSTPAVGADGKIAVQDPTMRGTLENYMPTYVDASDSQANRGFVVSFQHVPSYRDVFFKAFIMTYNETFSSDWAQESVYGRADPIYMFKQNTRNLTLAIGIPAATESEAYENLIKVQHLVQFLYPTYESSNAASITNSPLIRLRIMNIVKTSAFSDGGETLGDLRDGENDPSSESGLLGAITNLTINKNLDNPDYGVIQTAEGKILPKMIEINLSFAAIHESHLGWESDGHSQDFQTEGFPYNVQDQGLLPDSAGNTEPNFLDVHNANQQYYADLNNRLDELQEIAIANEQDKLHREARYAGMLGKSRAKNDVRRRDALQRRSNALENKANNEDRDFSEGRRERLQARSDRKQDRADARRRILGSPEDYAEFID